MSAEALFDGGGRQTRTVVTVVPDPRAERIVDVILAAIAQRTAG